MAAPALGSRLQLWCLRTPGLGPPEAPGGALLTYLLETRGEVGRARSIIKELPPRDCVQCMIVFSPGAPCPSHLSSQSGEGRGKGGSWASLARLSPCEQPVQGRPVCPHSNFIHQHGVSEKLGKEPGVQQAGGGCPSSPGLIPSGRERQITEMRRPRGTRRAPKKDSSSRRISWEKS